jgi:hypothetical protein
MLPAFVRYYDVESQLLIFERSPENRIVRFDDKAYEIQLPWIIYAACVSNLKDFHLFFNTSQLNALDDELSAASLPNMTTDGRFCVAKPNVLSKYNSTLRVIPKFRDQVAYIVSTVWDSPFNSDYVLDPSNIPGFVPADIRDKIVSLVNKAETQVEAWHIFLAWWEENVDLYTAMQWNTSSKYKLSDIMPKKSVIPEDCNASVVEGIVFRFFEQYYRSVG